MRTFNARLNKCAHNFDLYNSQLQTDHWCAPPSNLANLTVEMWLNISSPLTDDGSYDRCNVFAVDFEEEELMRPPEDTGTVPCTRWDYDESFLQV